MTPEAAASLSMETQPLSRTTSTESTPSAVSTASWQPSSGRKARASEPQAGGESIEVKLSPLGTAALAPMRPVGLTARRPSKASESLMDYFGRNNAGSAIEEDVDATPLAAARYPSSLTDAKSRSDVESADNRLSFSSLYSIGSAIYANTRGHSWSGRSSVVGSEPDNPGVYSHRLHHTDLCMLACAVADFHSQNVRASPTQHRHYSHFFAVRHHP